MDPGPEETGSEIGPWSRRRQVVAAILWSSFLAACAGSVLLFGLLDPLDVFAISTPALPVSRMTGYAIGFFFLWLVAALAAWLARTLLARPRP
ncbi:MAG: hypothetical protein JJT85_05015 [Chromatiales bacterium]|nr:hypothetical protein [Chromatiales bacterium]